MLYNYTMDYFKSWNYTLFFEKSFTYTNYFNYSKFCKFCTWVDNEVRLLLDKFMDTSRGRLDNVLSAIELNLQFVTDKAVKLLNLAELKLFCVKILRLFPSNFNA